MYLQCETHATVLFLHDLLQIVKDFMNYEGICGVDDLAKASIVKCEKIRTTFEH